MSAPSPSPGQDLVGLVEAFCQEVRQWFALVEGRPGLPMISRRFVRDELQVYFRCAGRGMALARYGRSMPSAWEAPKGCRAVVIADVMLAQRLRGHGFVSMLTRTLAQRIEGLCLLEFENVFNADLVAQLRSSGWRMRNGSEVVDATGLGGCWFLELGTEEVAHLECPPQQDKS